MSSQPEQQPEQQNDIRALRTILFDTLKGLKDQTLEVDRAKTICETSQVIINSVKAEIDFAKATGLQPSSEFIPTAQLPKPEPRPALKNLREKGILPEETSRPGISHPAPGVTRHIMR
ncbi:MAG: hypothetical protein ACYC1F_10390 [Gallionellaceae bacterium]